jgi:prevent-host-death family protein
MPTTLPVSDLQRDFKTIAAKCSETREPIYLTRNGKPSLVVMDAQAFDDEVFIGRELLNHEMRILDAVQTGHNEYIDGHATTLEEARHMRKVAR